jgi:hypothetical protein
VTGTDPDAVTVVVIPEYVARHWWERALYNQVANRLRIELLGRPNTVVANVPFRGESPAPNGTVAIATGAGGGPHGRPGSAA